MSGTSLDGLDIALVSFNNSGQKYGYQIMQAATVSLPPWMKRRIEQIDQESARSVFELNQKIGLFFAQEVNAFLEKKEISRDEVSLIASHGQTVFHEPQNGFTVQLGCGSTLAHHTQINVVNNFRSLDVAAGGQGAPLVPIGDQFLFGDQADGFLNIGGFSNLTVIKDSNVRAFDICPGNLPLNQIAAKLGFPYDANGHFARQGKINETLLMALNQCEFYEQKSPKSLGTEWLNSTFSPLLGSSDSECDLLATVTEHIAIQISKTLNEESIERVFVTGGGAHNGFLMERIQTLSTANISIPDAQMIDYKEALVFAFLGLRYLEQKHNCLSSVTGASKSVCGGTFHQAH